MEKITTWNLKLLQTFALVAEHRSFRKAADESHRSQSAVSAQIKTLEEQIGVRLFDRTTRRVSLTTEGAELLDYTRRAFTELTGGIVSIRKAVAAKSERVRVACIPTVTPGPVPTILTQFEARHPNVVVSIRELNNEDIIACVQNREVDFGIGVTVPAADCRFAPLMLDEMCALVGNDILGEEQSEIAMGDLIAMPLFLLPQATPTLVAIEKEARRKNMSLIIGHRFAQPLTMINMAAAGRGAAVLPRIFVDEIRHSKVQVLRIVEPAILREISIITPSGTKLSAPAEALVNVVRSVFATQYGNAAHP